MFEIPLEYFRSETVHRNIGNDVNNGVLSCGYLNKKTGNCSDKNITFEYYGALLLLSGTGVHIDNKGHEYKLYPGCFIQRIPGKIHSTYVHPDGKWLEFFICFGRQLFEALTNIGLLDDEQDVLYPGLNMAIFDTLNNFMHSLSKAEDIELPMLLTEAQRIILTTYRMHNENITKNENMEIIKQACQIINQDQFSRISAREVAGKIGIGYEKFRKLFKSKVGISPSEFTIQRRMNNAKSLLIDTKKSIKEISIELGFPDPFTFTKQFKKVVGVSPSNFRCKY